MNDEPEREGDAEEQSGVVNERERERDRNRERWVSGIHKHGHFEVINIPTISKCTARALKKINNSVF